MDFATFVSRVGNFMSNSDGAYFVVYAVVTCFLTELVKKLFVNKTKVDVLHKFDLAPVLPFIFGLAFAVADMYLVQRVKGFSLGIALRIIISALSIGALSSTGFKFIKSLSGQSLSDLMKNDVFAVFYNQLLYFGNVRQQMKDKNLTLNDFVEQVKLLASNAEQIYKQDDSIDFKRCRLAKLLSGIVDDQNIDTCVNAINDALARYVQNK